MESTSLESIIKSLESLVETLEKEETSLEMSMDAFGQGVDLVRKAQGILAQSEQRIAELTSIDPDKQIVDDSGEVTANEEDIS